MENKTGKPNTKVNAKNKSVRISLENQKMAEKILTLANKKKLGRKIKIDHVLAIALNLVRLTNYSRVE